MAFYHTSKLQNCCYLILLEPHGQMEQNNSKWQQGRDGDGDGDGVLEFEMADCRRRKTQFERQERFPGVVHF